MEKLGILFAGGGGDPKNQEPPDAEVDNPDVDDPKEDDLDLSKIFEENEEADDEDDDEIDTGEEEETDEDEEPEEEPEDKQTKQPPKQQESEKKPEKTFTQEEVNRMIQDRLNRQRKQFEQSYTQVNSKLAELERLTGMDVDSIATNIRQAQVKARADDWGISEDEARNILENEQKAQKMEHQLRQQQQQNEQTQRMVNYDRDKQKLMSKYPQIKGYEQEIDAFAQNGAALNFEPAMKYVLGQAILEGKIDVEKDVEQKVLANTKKKGKTKPEKAGSGGGADSSIDALSKQEKILARNLGLSYKDFLASKKQLEKQKKVKGS